MLIYHSYPLAPNCENTEILRVVVRESLSGDLARKLVHDILQVYVFIRISRFKADVDLSTTCRTEDLLNDAGPSYSMSTATRHHEDIDHGKLEGIDAAHIKVRTYIHSIISLVGWSLIWREFSNAPPRMLSLVRLFVFLLIKMWSAEKKKILYKKMRDKRSSVGILQLVCGLPG